ncbi:S-layer homology domain-containing protein, partial [Clostridium aminobutyricum]
VTITVDNASKGYGAADPTFTGTVGELVAAGDLGTVTYTRTNSDVNDIGTYADVITANYTPNGNYNVTVVNGDFEITALPMSDVTAAGYAAPYDGIAHGITVSGAPDGATIEYSLDGATNWTTANPTYTDVTAATPVYYRVSKVGYATVTGSKTVEITAKAVTITVDNASKGYGAADPTFTGTVGELVAAGDLGTVTYTRTNSDVNTVGKYEDVITAAYIANSNYEVTVVKGDFEITAKELIITADSASKRYDGTALTDSGWQDTEPTGLVNGDTVMYVYVSGSAINVESKPNVARNAIILTADYAENGTSWIANWIQEAISQAMTLDEAITSIRGEIGAADVTSNYAITYVDGTLTITSGGGGGGHNNGGGSTTIQDEDVPLAGTPELNKADHFNYIKGYEDGKVKAQNNITREEVATIFYRLLTDSSRAIYFTQDEDFSDVASNRWSLNAIATLANGGIIEGYNDGTFGATKAITRAEFATIASRFDTLEDGDGTTFSDISGNWAEKYIKSAAKKGWITGYNDGTFKPTQNITRAEAMTLINRVLDRRVNEAGLIDGYKVFPDNKSTDWFYYQVIEATNNHDYAERQSMSDMETWTKIKEDKTWTE